jgi:hypothetical protein
VVIWASAAFAGFESIGKLIAHRHTTHVAAGIVGAVLGVIGNQAVACYKRGVGKRINSATLIADARHSWLDALSPPRQSVRPAIPRIVIDLGYAGTYRHVTWPSVRGVHAHCRLRWRPGITPGITRGWARLIPAVIRVRTSWRSFRQAGRRPCCGPGTGSLRR